MAHIPGTDGADDLIGSHKDDQMYAKDGDDKVVGGHGKDTMYGGKGNDSLEGGKDADKLWGGEGNDKLDGGRGNDTLHDEFGVNIVDGGRGVDTYMLDGSREDYHFSKQDDGSVIVTKVGVSSEVFQTTLIDVEKITFRNEIEADRCPESGQLENCNPNETMDLQDALNGCYQNVENLEGVKENVTVGGVEYDYHYKDVTGDDCFIGGGDKGEFSTDANYFIQGSVGDDRIGGNDGDDRLQGGKGNDRIWGGGGDDILRGGAGNDTVKGGTGNDLIRGGAGDDYVSGEQGDDVIFGGNGNDEVDGGDGNDILYGGQGDDLIFGCAGDDILIDENGTNMVKGGAGTDTFVLTGSREDYVFTLGENGEVIVTRAEGAEGPEFTTTLVDVEQVAFDVPNVDFDKLPEFNGENTVDIFGDLITDF